MVPDICRWGILGTAGIARKNWQAIARAGNATVAAVASRSLDRSRRFVAECQADCPLPGVPDAVGSYDELPTQVTARLLAEAASPGSPSKVPFEMSGEFLFPGGVSASFYCSFQTENQQWASVSGTRGLVHVPDFVLPFFGDEVRFEVLNSVFDVRGCEFHMQRRSRSVVVPEYSNSHPTAQEANLFRTFSDLVTTGRLDRRWGEIALATQRVLDACVESAKVGRPVALGT